MKSNNERTSGRSLPAFVHTSPRNFDWLTLAQFALSALAILCLWGSALMFALFGLVGVFANSERFADPMSLFLLVATNLLSGTLLLPSAGYALGRIMGWNLPNLPSLFSRRRIVWVIVALIFVLLLGQFASSLAQLAWLVLPPLHVLAVGLPILCLVYLSIRGLPLGSPQRRWGVFGSGLVLGSSLVLVAEITAGLFLLVVAIVIIASQPEWVNQISSLSKQLSGGEASSEEMLELVVPFLLKPAVIASTLAFAAGIVPLIEEIFKPIGVWLLIGRDLSPAEGFAAGALSGAGYALFESLLLSSNGDGIESWIFLVVARIGTAIIHILTSGLMGWALVQVWKKGRYIRLAFAYLAAVSIHSLWNGLALVSSFSLLASQQPSNGGAIYVAIGGLAAFCLVALAAVALSALIWFNRRLARALASEPPLDGATLADKEHPQGDSLQNDGIDPVSD